MQKKLIELPELTVVGLTVRTQNINEMEPAKAKIGPLHEKYWSKKMANLIPHRKNPGRTYSIYTEYDTDEHGEYTYLLGEAVNQIEGELPEGFKAVKIKSSRYQQFITDLGPIPDIIINAWRQIWLLSDKDFGGKRAYQADFEVIDTKTIDHNNASVSIYIGIQ